MNELNFTKAALDALSPAPEGKRVRYRDTKVGGLVLRVSDRGGKVFYVYKKVQGRPVEIKLGQFPAMSVDVARTKAQEANVAVAKREDPGKAVGKLVHDPTLKDLFTWWVGHVKARRTTWRQDERNFARYLKQWANRRASTITPAEVREHHAHLGRTRGHATANRVMSMLRAVFVQAAKHDRFEGGSPTTGLEWFPEESRERRLMPEEMEAFLAALDDIRTAPYFRDIVMLLLFTGARKGNVLAMRWDQIDWLRRVWRIPITKNKRPVEITLGADEIEILQRRKAEAEETAQDEGKDVSPWVFPGREWAKKGHLVDIERSWEDLKNRAGLDDLHIHDLRRTLGSFMVDTGASLPMIGKALGHKSQSATAIYARFSQDPIREAKGKAVDAMLRGRRRSTSAGEEASA